MADARGSSWACPGARAFSAVGALMRLTSKLKENGRICIGLSVKATGHPMAKRAGHCGRSVSDRKTVRYLYRLKQQKIRISAALTKLCNKALHLSVATTIHLM